MSFFKSIVGTMPIHSNLTRADEMVQGVFINLAEHLLNLGGAADESRLVTKMERDQNHMGINTHEMVLTTGLEFRFASDHDPRSFLQVRVEGPRWLGAQSRQDIQLGEIERWVMELQRSLPTWTAAHLSKPGYVSQLGDIGIHVFVWKEEPVEYDDIPWGEVLPAGFVHVIAPPFVDVENNPCKPYLDQTMINLGLAVQGVLETRKVVWWQFGETMEYENHATIRDHLGAGLTQKEDTYLHCLHARDSIRFMHMFPEAHRKFDPQLTILYNPWVAPVGDTYGMPHKNDFDYWADFLENLLMPPGSTLIALNRVPESQMGDLRLVPWQIFPVKQRFK